MALTIHINHSSSDYPLNTSGVDWIEVDTDNDRLIISDGSATVADGQVSPGEAALNSAGLVITALEQTFDTYLLDDASVALLKEIYLMGAGNYRYVMAFDFDAATATEPVLEAWDDSDLDTTASVVLGAGTPANSWIKGVTTTAALPGASWSGDPLAGSTDGNYLELNNGSGELTVATTLYANLKVVLPISQTDGGASTPVLVVKWATV